MSIRTVDRDSSALSSMLKLAYCVIVPVTACGAAHAQSTEEGHVEEVLVTARKQQESLQRVPVSISAIGAAELTNRSLDDLAAVGQSTPNFTFSEQPQGGRGAGVAYIRGVGQSDTLATYDPAVGVYIDGVYLGRLQGNDLEMMEVERLEVLRGPQGTLFGKNTSGGAVSILTKQPDAAAGALGGRIQLTAGNRDHIDVLASVNAPLVINRAALQMSVMHRKQDGFGKRADGQDTGSTDRWIGRASLKLIPTDNLTATVTLDGTTYDETNSVAKLALIDTTAAPIAALNAFTTQTYDERWITSDVYLSHATGPNSSRGDLWGASVVLNYATPWGEVKSITAYRDNDVHNDLDPDLSPITLIDQYSEVRQDQFSQELQATGTAFSDRLSWIGGLYYFKENADDLSDYILLTPLFGLSQSFSRNLYIKNESFAGYAQGSYNLTDSLRITVGARVTQDKKQVARELVGYPAGLPNPADPMTTGSASWTDFSPRLGFDYQWTPSIMTYISISKGYKGGGFNGRANSVAYFTKFEPEEVWAYEVGFRSDLFDRKVRFNATAFYSSYEDMQLPLDATTSAGGAPQPFNFVVNVPKSSITGGEVELTVIPIHGLTFSSGVGLTYGEYLQMPVDSLFLAYPLVEKDSQFINAPEVSLAASLEYKTGITSDLGATSRIDWAHRSTTYFDRLNSPYLRQQPYSLLNAKITFEHETSGLSLSFYATNLTDEHYIVGGFNDADTPHPALGFTSVVMGAPREFGVSAQVRF